MAYFGLLACAGVIVRRRHQRFVTTSQPMGQIPEVKDIVEAVLYLAEAGQVTGEVLHVDGGAHVGK
jgi:NAD(P)-dependent dehydrogenase (short-subunit alcohol dehydrogenase family)